ncbi:restriction endonuclease [Janibacter hoylei]|uniref:restriction endonuclease n=1 Tax=Janibacter hoylei TaxID=364298 RepID=UPI0027BA1B67|nr:restriction endonuclease [Janibacter hoylei]
MDGRVPWGRFEGNDVEAVVAMMLNREHPDSVRITPSRGDGGVDILDRGAADGGGDIVYQVKSYCAPLTARQKSEVEKSLARLLDPEKRDPRWKDLSVSVWRLVTPWDPTPESDAWMQRLGSTYKVEVRWDGLTVVDQLSTRYDDVVDFYLYGGRSAVARAYESAMAMMSMATASDSSIPVAELAARIGLALGPLDRDPHYQYELRFGHGEPADPPPRPRYMFGQYLIDPHANTWHAIDVIARCAESANQRPVTVKGQLKAQPASDFAHALKDFAQFGTPFTSPEGAFTGNIDAPGGLGGDLQKATVAIKASEQADLGDNSHLRLVILDPEGVVLAETLVNRTERSYGSAGLRVVLTEANGIFELHQRFNLADGTTNMRFEVHPVAGKPASVALPATAFLAAFHSPNAMRVSSAHSPGWLGSSDSIPDGVDAAFREHARRRAELLRTLDQMQQKTSTVITIPDIAAVSSEQVRDWRLVARILSGEAVTVTLPEGTGLDVTLAPGTTAPHDTFEMLLPLEVQVGGQPLDFGHVLVELTNPQLVADLGTDDKGRRRLRYTTPDRTVQYSLPGATRSE